MGAALQLLSLDSLGFHGWEGRWMITPLLTGISYFRFLYLYHGSCCVMLPDASVGKMPFLLHAPAALLMPSKVAVRSGTDLPNPYPPSQMSGVVT